MKKLLAVTATSVALVLVFSATAAAQCGQFYDCRPGMSEPHEVLFAGMSMVQFPHTGCNTCIGPEGTTREDCHPSCNVSLMLGGPVQNVAYGAMMKAAGAGNVEAVLRYAPLVPQFVRFNPERRSIQIASCDGDQIVANLSLQPGTQTSLATLLPRHSGTVAAGPGGPWRIATR